MRKSPCSTHAIHYRIRYLDFIKGDSLSRKLNIKFKQLIYDNSPSVKKTFMLACLMKLMLLRLLNWLDYWSYVAIRIIVRHILDREFFHCAYSDKDFFLKCFMLLYKREF